MLLSPRLYCEVLNYIVFLGRRCHSNGEKIERRRIIYDWPLKRNLKGGGIKAVASPFPLNSTEQGKRKRREARGGLYWPGDDRDLRGNKEIRERRREI